MMNKKYTIQAMTAALALLMTTVAVGPVAAQSSKEKARQRDKNTTRNLAAGLGAAAIYEGINGRKTSAVLLGAGALYSGKKYEDARKAQSKENNVRRVYRYQNGKRIGYYKYVGNKRVGYVRFK